MAPLGISVGNLLIESSSLSCLTESRQAKKEQGFAQKFSSDSSREPSTSPPPSNTTNLFFLGGGNGSVGGGTSAASNGTTSSQPFSKTTISSSRIDDGTNLSNNNNYFTEPSQQENAEKGERRSSTENNFRTGEPSSPSFSTLYSIFWEKFKKPSDQKEENNTYRPFSSAVEAEGLSQEFKQKNNGEAEHFKNYTKSGVSFDDKSSSAYKKFYERAQQINSQLLPVWYLLSYPSDLHYYGRAAVMTVVTANVIEKTLEKLPDIEQLGKMYGPLFHCNLLDGSDPNQPERVGLDKDFF